MTHALTRPVSFMVTGLPLALIGDHWALDDALRRGAEAVGLEPLSARLDDVVRVVDSTGVAELDLYGRAVPR